MRLNKYIAQATGMSRRAADTAISGGRVAVNNAIATVGQTVSEQDKVTLDNRAITPAVNTITIMFNKPAGYVCSRNGQGSKTIYDLLPEDYHNLKPVGRLDKNSSGLLLLTNDGQLAYELTHPSRQKTKIYKVMLDKSLEPLHQQMISDFGVQLDDGPSKLQLQKLDTREKQIPNSYFQVTMSEGRNRQIRRTFSALGYTVTYLHRTHFGPYDLSNLTPGNFKEL